MHIEVHRKVKLKEVVELSLMHYFNKGRRLDFRS